jgi:uncharacterized protein involved in outer membrane biogenesis
VIRRIALIASAVLLIAVITAVGATYWFFSSDGLRRALEGQVSAWLGHPVRIGAARARFVPRVAIQLDDIRVGEPSRLTLDSIALSADLRPLFDRRIENADVLVSGSRIDMPLPFRMPSATPSAEAGDAERAVRIVSIRTISLRDVRLRSRGREIVVSADSSLDASTLTLSRFDAKTGGTTLGARGAVTLAPRIDAKLTATANRLDLDELLALADAFTPPSAPGQRAAASRARITADLTAEQATAGSLKVSQLAAQLAVDGDAVQLAPLSFQAFDGRYEGRVAARLGDRISATLQATVANVDIAQLAAFGGSPDTVSGRMRGEGTFTGAGADISTLLQNARGKGTATIVKGSMRRLNLIRTIVLFFGRPAADAEQGTDNFDQMDVSFSLVDRQLRADAFSLKSADADMAGSGTLHLANDALDARVDITLSEALSAQAGTDLYRYTREGNRIVLPAAIGGTLDAPRLTIDARAAVGRGLRNEIERRLKGILDGLGR